VPPPAETRPANEPGMPKIGSCFTGVAGLDMAVEAVTGGRVVWHSEVDPAASKVLATHYPDIPNHGDITAIDWDAVEPVDILCGGPPCQDVSAAGAKAGLGEGTRSGLWAHMAHAIEMLEPKLVIIENVRGLLSTKANRHNTIGEHSEQPAADSGVEPANHAVGQANSRRREPVLRAIGAIFGDLAERGYHAAFRTVRASDVGAPHIRARVFILAWRHDVNPADWIAALDFRPAPAPAATLLPTPVTTDARSAARHTTSTGVMHPGTTLTDAVRSMMLPTPTSADGRRGPDLARANRAGSGADDLVTFAVKTSRANTWHLYGPVINHWAMLTQPPPDPTEPNNRGNPRLAPPFAEWMLGWPAGWVTGVPDLNRTAQLTCIGNGVCPQQAAFALRLLLDDAAGAT